MRFHHTTIAYSFALAGVLAAVLVVSSGCGSSSAAVPPAAATPAATPSGAAPSGCQSDPHAGVHDANRLTILNPCTTFVGTLVATPKLSSDGDIAVNAKPDPGYEKMLNAKNHEGLHLEVMPRDQPGCTPGQPIKGTVNNLGTCSGANVVLPPKGTHVKVTGPWVFDSWVGWNEIHPVWKVEIIPAPGQPPPTPPPTTTAPLPPKTHSFAARLAGGAKNVPRGSGLATIKVTGNKLCWSFSRLKNIGKATRSDIHVGLTRAKGATALALGSRFKVRGCMTVDERRLEQLASAPRRYYVTIYTARYPLGAAHGRLAPTSD